MPFSHVVWRRLAGIRPNADSLLRGWRGDAVDRHGALSWPRNRLGRYLRPLGLGASWQNRSTERPLQYLPDPFRQEYPDHRPTRPGNLKTSDVLVDFSGNRK